MSIILYMYESVNGQRDSPNVSVCGEEQKTNGNSENNSVNRQVGECLDQYQTLAFIALW